MAASYSGVEEAYRKKNQAIDQSTAAGAAGYDAQRTDTKDNTTGTLQQLYLQNARNRALTPQQTRAAGITGGAAESVGLAQTAAYNSARTNALLEQERQLSEINITQNQAAAQAEVDKAQNNVELETGRLSFDQQESQQRRSELWELVKAGVITDMLAAELGYSANTLRTVYQNRYKKEES